MIRENKHRAHPLGVVQVEKKTHPIKIMLIEVGRRN